MAASFLQKAGQFSKCFKRHLSTSVAAVPLTEALPNLPYSPSATSGGQPASVQVTQLSNGITVTSQETGSPYTNIAVYIRCGSRVENYNEQGLTHLLRNCAFLTTQDKTAFGLLRELDYLGACVSATTTREYVIYSAECLRDNQEQIVKMLGGAISSPSFLHWEVEDQMERLKLDSVRASNEPDTVVFEGLHKASFRSGLSNSLYCPPYHFNKFTGHNLKEFVSQWYIGQHMTIVGTGIDHQDLVNYTQMSLATVPEGDKSNPTKSDYVGGNEVRLEGGSPLAHVGVVCKGASLTSSSNKELITAGVLEYLLGGGPSIKWGSGSATARLNKAVATTVDAPFVISALNLPYSDNGLFGIYAVSNGTTMGQVLKSAIKEFSDIAKGHFTSEDLLRAKNQYIANVLMSIESQLSLTHDIGTQVSMNGSYSPLEESIINAITEQDIVQFVKTVFATRPTLVAHGNLSATPRLDELLSGISFK